MKKGKFLSSVESLTDDQLIQAVEDIETLHFETGTLPYDSVVRKIVADLLVATGQNGMMSMAEQEIFLEISYRWVKMKTNE